MSAHSARKPWWQQATALVTVSTGGVITGFSFVPGAAATMTSPTSMPLHLLALQKSASEPADAGDAPLRSAIVNVASYYLRLAKTHTPEQMEAMIWGKDSVDGADHGPSCAAFASLTLELAAQAVGKQSWVTGGTTYPWPLREWADVRVDPNPDSLAITSILQDARAHDRWHPLGDGYLPQPGDWVLFSGHVEVVTGYTDGALDTIGADSLPNLTVNAHAFSSPLADQGVQGYVDNGHLASASGAAGGAGGTAQSPPASGHPAGDGPGAGPRSGSKGGPAGSKGGPVGSKGGSRGGGRAGGRGGLANIPGTVAGGPVAEGAHGSAAIPGVAAAGSAAVAIPGPANATPRSADGGAGGAGGAGGSASGQYRKNGAPGEGAAPRTRTQQAFISQIAPGAIAAQQRYGVPASVTIAQAIDESGWGASELASQDHNLFGIKGTGPAGSVELPTQEYQNGQWVTVKAPFRVYHNIAESIADHAELLATSGYYQRAMADRAVPDAFANDLTGVYATDPDYGANLIALMRLYNLYRFDAPPDQPHANPAGEAPASSHPRSPRAPSPHPHPHPHPPASAVRGSAVIPGTAPMTGVGRPAGPAADAGDARGRVPAPGAAAVPGLTAVPRAAAVRGRPAQQRTAQQRTAQQRTAAAPVRSVPRRGARIPGIVTPATPRYQAELPAAVTTAYFASAKTPIARATPLYRDVASQTGIRWELLAACDWMQCQAHPRYSPVHGEKIGMPNPDGTVYPTKSEALAQCAKDLIRLTAAVYGVDLTTPEILSVRALADAFAAFRWGALLVRHRVSAMEFPYSVAGLTPHHLKMHWPAISEPDAPDKPGGKFRMPFGAVPLLLSLKYPATV